MLQLEGANTISNTIIDDLWTTAAAREVTQKAPSIDDIDKIIVAISELMEIMKTLQEEIFSQIWASADLVEKDLQAENNKKERTLNTLKIMVATYCPKIAAYVF